MNLPAPCSWETVGYRFHFDRSNCLNCGVCMDVCPVQALDMSRNLTLPVESGAETVMGWGQPSSGKVWMMEFPVQVGECIGCQVCVAECPTSVIDLETLPATEPITLAPRQGPIVHAPAPQTGWIPLSAYTRESLKEEHTDPWGSVMPWRSAKRTEVWQTWRSWMGSGEGRLLAPCQEACPVGTDAGLYVGLIAEGRYADALAVAAEFNPFPSICGRVCTAPCEVACRRGVLDEPIAIRHLKRFAADHGMEGYPQPPRSSSRHRQRVAIVGAGPTGLSAAYLLTRSGYAVTVFEAMPVPGGMMAIGIPEYRLPKAILRAEVDRIIALGVELRLNAAMGRDFTLDDLKRDGFDVVLLATGAHKAQPLGVPGETLDGVWPATVFLKKVNLGEPFQLSGEVLVVGGGSTALDAARSAWRAGADQVRVLYRRTRDDMPAQHEEVRAAEHEGVLIESLVAPVAVLGHGSITGLRCVRLQVTGQGDDGRSQVAKVPDSEFTLPASGLMVAVGEAPDPSILPAGSNVQVAAWGGFVVDPETLTTSREGVFAAGDVATGPRSVIEGVAQGQRAAWAMDRYLRKQPASHYIAPWRIDPSSRATGAVRIDLANRYRAEPPLAAVTIASDAQACLREVALGFDEAAALAEGARCLRCDITSACQAAEITRRLPA